MSQNQHQESHPLSASDLDPEKVGQIVLRLAAASALAGHTTVGSTVRDYIRRQGVSDEMTFVRDLFVRSTKEITDRWYGGEFEAARMTAETLAARYG